MRKNDHQTWCTIVLSVNFCVWQIPTNHLKNYLIPHLCFSMCIQPKFETSEVMSEAKLIFEDYFVGQMSPETSFWDILLSSKEISLTWMVK